VNRFLAALQFLTIISIPWRREAKVEEVGRSTGYFPVIGLIIGLILAGLNGLNWLLGLFLPSDLFLPSAVVNVLLIVAMVVISGALHLDGFVDTCDGIAGHKTVEDRWKVMRDSRVGGFGIVGVVLLLLLKYVSLNSIPGPLMMMTLVLMPVLSRWAMVYAIFTYPYAKPSGLGKAFKQGTSWPRFTMATIITVVVVAILALRFSLALLFLMFVIWIITVVMAAYLKSKFSGLTGDNYGAINEVAEVAVLILINLLVQVGLI